MASPVYVLGHSEHELERLKAQERLIGPFTRHLFQRAGIGPGMRLLEIGSGAGDVAILAADLVGPSGSVVGADVSSSAIAHAKERVKALGLPQVSFELGDPTDLDFSHPFDAIVGRYVLLFQADGVSMLRKLVKHLRPTGVIVFHEPDWSFVRSDPAAPLYDLSCRRIVETFRLAKTDTNMASRLFQLFTDADFPAPTMLLHAFIGGSAGAVEWIKAVADLTTILLPTMVKLGVVDRDNSLSAKSLFEQMQAEILVNRSMIVGRAEIGAWSRIG